MDIYLIQILFFGGVIALGATMHNTRNRKTMQTITMPYLSFATPATAAKTVNFGSIHPSPTSLGYDLYDGAGLPVGTYTRRRDAVRAAGRKGVALNG